MPGNKAQIPLFFKIGLCLDSCSHYNRSYRIHTVSKEQGVKFTPVNVYQHSRRNLQHEETHHTTIIMWTRTTVLRDRYMSKEQGAKITPNHYQHSCRNCQHEETHNTTIIIVNTYNCSTTGYTCHRLCYYGIDSPIRHVTVPGSCNSVGDYIGHRRQNIVANC